MKLYYAPGACSLGIHVLLEEIGKPYEGVVVICRQARALRPGFTDGQSEVQGADTRERRRLGGDRIPRHRLLAGAQQSRRAPAARGSRSRDPRDRDVDYAVSTVHMQGASRLFRPSNYTPNAADEGSGEGARQGDLEKGLALLDKALDGKDYVAGAFSIADAAVFYVEYWAAGPLKLTLPANCAAHYQRMMARPAVQRTLQAEGLAA